MRASKCPAPAVCVRAPIRVLLPPGALSRQQGFRARLVRSRSNKGSATGWCAHASKRFCARSLRGNTFSGYKFDNKRPPAQSPKMMIVRERPHSPNRTACTAHSVRRPRASPYGMPRTSRFARQSSLPVPCCVHKSPSSTKIKEAGADEERGRVARRRGGKWRAGGRENGYGRKKLDF